MTHDLVQQPSKAPAEAAGRAGELALRRVFLDHTHAGWFIVTAVEQTPARRESHVPGLFIVPYRVTLEAKEVLPPVDQKLFVLVGSKGEGPEAGALGLQDWLPTTVGSECVLAFDPQQLPSAEHVEYLGAGPDAESVWQSVKRFYESLQSEQGVDSGRIAATIGREPLLQSTFFQLVFAYDRRVYQNPAVVRALGAYLANDRVPALDRRTTVAHYVGQPGDQDAQALHVLAGGLLQLALHLVAEGQTASAGVVFQRVAAYVFDSGTNVARVPPPALSEGQRMALVQLLNSPEIALNATSHRSLRSWIQP